jgi:hypothetical protein
VEEEGEAYDDLLQPTKTLYKEEFLIGLLQNNFQLLMICCRL